MDAARIAIESYMTPEPCGVDHALTLADALDRMQANDIRHLLVLRDETLVGAVSLRDLELAIAVFGGDDAADDTEVGAVAHEVLACPHDTSVADVARTMEARHLDCAAVIGDHNEVVGIFTVTDALRAVRELALGHPVEREVSSTHRMPAPVDDERVLPTVRVKRMLRGHNAAPSPNDGTAFGKVFPNR